MVWVRDSDSSNFAQKKKDWTKCPLAERATGVCHTLAFAIYIKKKDLKAKRRIMETEIFHHAKI
jgi:hypothetical protein